MSELNDKSEDRISRDEIVAGLALIGFGGLLAGVFGAVDIESAAVVGAAGMVAGIGLAACGIISEIAHNRINKTK